MSATTFPHREPTVSPADDEPSTSRDDLQRILIAWGGASTGVGVLLTVLGQVTGSDPTRAWALAATAAGLLAGVAAWRLDAWLGRDRPTLLDAHGRRVRSVGSWLFALPLATGAATLLLLAVVGSVRTGSLLPALVFGGLALSLGWVARSALTQSRLKVALTLADAGSARPARAALLDLAEAWWTTTPGRAHAQLTLGYLALVEDELDSAARWYSLPRERAVGGHAAVGLALVRALQARYDEAEHHAQRATQLGRGGVQAEVDGVRLLCLLLQEGPNAAREHGERLFDERAGGLFRVALAVAHHRGGAPDLAIDRLRGALSTAAMPPLRRILPDLGQIAADER